MTLSRDGLCGDGGEKLLIVAVCLGALGGGGDMAGVVGGDDGGDVNRLDSGAGEKAPSRRWCEVEADEDELGFAIDWVTPASDL
jgi:hypothetical protein